jgi:hypothetical protein
VHGNVLGAIDTRQAIVRRRSVGDRARIVPACPTHLESLLSPATARSVDEAVPELTTRNQTAVETSEQAISMSRHDVVRAVADHPWQQAHHLRRPPRPPQCTGDKEHGVAPGDDACGRGPVIGHHVERSEFIGIPTAPLHDGPADVALERSKPEHATAIVAEQELQKAAAETADAVVQDEVSTGDRPRRLRLGMNHV